MRGSTAVEYYPVFLDLRDRPCVVVGGGASAAAKVEALLRAGARVTVVAAEAGPRLAALAAGGAIRHLPRPYRRGDLAGAFLAISVLADPGVAQAFWQEAEAAGIVANVMDDPARSSFIAPSVVRRGDLAVAVSTSGKAPALAVRLREWLEACLGDEYARFLDLAGRAREPLKASEPGFEERRRRWYRLVDSDVLPQLARGEDEAARRRAEEILGVELAPAAGHEAAGLVPAGTGGECEAAGGALSPGDGVRGSRPVRASTLEAAGPVPAGAGGPG